MTGTKKHKLIKKDGDKVVHLPYYPDDEVEEEQNNSKMPLVEGDFSNLEEIKENSVQPFEELDIPVDVISEEEEEKEEESEESEHEPTPEATPTPEPSEHVETPVQESSSSVEESEAKSGPLRGKLRGYDDDSINLSVGGAEEEE